MKWARESEVLGRETGYSRGLAPKTLRTTISGEDRWEL